MPEYLKLKEIRDIPRLPLEGSLDLTYRCNNTCRHCWLWLAPNAREQADELSFDEIRRIADEARALGTRKWSISGGEPMLRPDFPEVFDYLTRKAITYSLNTNGTLITPEIAQLLKRKGSKMIALYGATAETYDRVTRHEGGFEKAVRGLRYMQEAGAGFTVQLIPMRANWHQWDQMIELAKSLSPHWRVGAAWLYLSSSGSPHRNAEIARQRLDPRTVIELDRPDVSYEEAHRESTHEYHRIPGDDCLFASCIAERREFHVDPYGQMTFCCFIKDPALRYDLRRGTFREAWDVFIPSLADRVRGGPEYLNNCAACELRNDCRWCPVYGYLEHGRFAAPVEYLCAVARENRRFKEDWKMNHRRYYRIAEITIQVDSDLPITEATFTNKLDLFRVEGPGDDTVTIRHHFELPNLRRQDLGKEVYRKRRGRFIGKARRGYISASRRALTTTICTASSRLTTITRARIYNDRDETWLKGDLHSLTLFPSDQILIAHLLADRNGCYLHSAGAILDGAGMLFVGHSDAGKSTITRLLMAHPHPALPLSGGGEGEGVEILCDDRNIVRKWFPPLSTTGEGQGGGEWRVYGTWSHGDVPVVSPASAPLRAILFLQKADENAIIPLTDRKEITRRLLACVIKPFVTAAWWHKTLDLIEQMAREVPCYVMRFDKSGEIVEKLSVIMR
ncbi:MAG: radical SAM protein [Anaerolineae bacterium]